MFTTSDIGWVVGHSYIVYGPLIHGMTTILYEGLPIRPDAGIWWKIVADNKVTVMFSSPTAARVLKKQDPGVSQEVRSSARCVTCFSPASRSTSPPHRWMSDAIGKPVIDHYWQTETGWPILSAMPGIEDTPIKSGSPSFPAFGYDLKLLRESDGGEAGPNEKGVVAIVPPLPPGLHDDGVGRRRALRAAPTSPVSATSWSTRRSTGAYATPTATISSSAAPTT